MRLLYLCQNFGEPLTSVASTRHYEIIRRLVMSGWEVHVITTDFRLPPIGVEHVQEEFGSRVTLDVIKTPYSNEMTVPRRKVEFLRVAAFMIVRALRPRADVTFASSTPLTVALPALTRKLLRRTPFVFEVRDLWPELPFAFGALKRGTWQGRVATRLARLTYQQAERIIALSPGMAAGIIDGYGTPARKVSVATNAADRSDVLTADSPAELDELSWFRQAHHRFIYGGTLGRANDVAWLVEVVRRCIDDHQMDVKLVIVGDGAERPAVEAAIRCSPASTSERIRVLGRRPKSNYLRLLAGATLSFNLTASNPLMRHASPNKVFDSFAAGVPVASNQGGWLAEALTAHLAGVNLPRDHEAAARLLAELDHSAIQCLREGAANAAEVYSWDRSAGTVHAALTAAMGPM